MNVSRTRLLVGLVGALALLLALEWLLPGQAAPIVAKPRQRPVAVATEAAPERDTDGWGDSILNRPVFSISRRPPRAVAGGKSESAPGQARLAGIMITRAGRRAIFAPEGGGKQMVLAERASVNQTTIQRILPDRVVLATGVELRPAYDRNRPQTTPLFQPIVPAFQPGFPQPGFPQPGFPQPGFPQPGFTTGFPQPGFQPAAPIGQAGAEDGVQPPPPPQPFRGPMIPQRRD